MHGRYSRTVSDLAWHGSCVTFKIRARRFFWDESSCERKIFCERLPDVAARARKAGGGLARDRPRARRQCGRPAGPRAGNRDRARHLPKRIKGISLPEIGKIRVLGVDDFAFKKGGTHGTILMSFEDHEAVDLLPERSQESLVA